MKKTRALETQKSGFDYFSDSLLAAAETLGSRVVIRGFLEKLGMKNPELWIRILSELPAPLLDAIKKNAGKLENWWTVILPLIAAEIPKFLPEGQAGTGKTGRKAPDAIGTVSAALELLLALHILRRKKWLKRFHPAVLALTLAVPLLLRGLALAGRRKSGRGSTLRQGPEPP